MDAMGSAGPVLLMAALLFLCGELYKKLGLNRHLVPAALGVTGVLLAAGLELVQGSGLGRSMTGGAQVGILGAALCVYLYQLVVQAGRADRFKAPFAGFYFDKKGEGQ